jgi:hypothetical protein
LSPNQVESGTASPTVDHSKKKTVPEDLSIKAALKRVHWPRQIKAALAESANYIAALRHAATLFRATAFSL